MGAEGINKESKKVRKKRKEEKTKMKKSFFHPKS